jgi:hypothetical protein
METTAGRGCHVDDRHVWAERAGGCERLIVGCQVGDHVESFGAQQGTAGGAGYLMIIDDHDPGRPAAAGGAISAGLHIATIAVRRHWPHRRYRQCQARPPWGRPSRISSAREVMPSLVLDELETADLVTLADKGYQGSTWAKVPYRGRNKPEPQKQANRAHAKLRAPGEQANAQLKAWKILSKLRCCPWRAGKLAKAIHALKLREA